MPKLFKRRGIAISPRMNKVRIAILLVITPLLTWYAHQRFTNPFKKHVIFELVNHSEAPMLHIYHETSTSKSDLLYINVSQSPLQTREKNAIYVQFYNDSLFKVTKDANTQTVRFFKTATSTLKYRNGILSVEAPFFSALVCYKILNNQQYIDTVDLLVGFEIPPNSVLALRKKAQPRLTITNSFPQANKYSNIYNWNGKKRLFFKEERYNRLKILDPEKD